MKKRMKRNFGVLLMLLTVLALASVSASAADKPVITSQPENVVTTMDGTAVFAVEADGATSYQWQYRAGKNKTWANAQGAGNRTSRMTFAPATLKRAGYQYRCAVKNSAGTTYSNVVNLYIKPSVTGSPVDVVTTADGSATFYVEAVGRFLEYQWQYKAPGKGWVNNSCREQTFVIENPGGWRNQYEYRCVVKNGVGKAVSEPATLYTKPTITRQPADVTVKASGSATFRVEAVGAKTYCWQYRKPGSTAWYNNGCTSAVFEIDTVGAWRDGYQYRCIVGNGRGTAVTSEIATLSLPFRFAQQLERSVYAAVGSVLELSVRVQGGQAPYTYTWYLGDQVGQSAVIKTAVSDSKTGTYGMEITEEHIGMLVWCVVEDSKGNRLAPNGYDDDPFRKMMILERVSLEISRQPEDTVISRDPDERKNYFPSIILSGRGSGNLLFQWQYAPGNVAETDLTDADYRDFTGRSADGEDFADWLDTQQIRLKQGQDLIDFVGDGKWIRCVVTDLESGTVLCSEPARLDPAP